MLSPAYIATAAVDSSADKLDWTIGKTKLPCVVLRNGRILSDNGLLKFCYEAGTTTLRYTRGQGWDETVYNDVFRFEGQNLARSVEVTHAGKPFLRIQLAKIESLPKVDDLLFAPPPGSPGPVAGAISVPSGVLMNEYLVHRESLSNFPRGVHGRVTIKFTVSKEGRVTHAVATDGPDQLRKPKRTL